MQHNRHSILLTWLVCFLTRFPSVVVVVVRYTHKIRLYPQTQTRATLSTNPNIQVSSAMTFLQNQELALSLAFKLLGMKTSQCLVHLFRYNAPITNKRIKTTDPIIERRNIDWKYPGSTCCSPREGANHTATPTRLKIRPVVKRIKRSQWRALILLEIKSFAQSW